MHATGRVSKAQSLGDGAVVLPGCARAMAADLLAGVAAIAARAPFRHMTTRQGFALSAAMTSAGARGWVSDRRGYRYERRDPASDRPWPELPADWSAFARGAALAGEFPDFAPDTCLINRYRPGARMGLHVDADEPDAASPVVSVSLGLPAVFLWGGLARADAVVPVRLDHGDVVVWGGPARRRFHGVRPLRTGGRAGGPGSGLDLGVDDTGAWPEVDGVTRHEGQPCRINLTFRRTGLGGGDDSSGVDASRSAQ